jgi:thiamine-monophosphate kinase
LPLNEKTLITRIRKQAPPGSAVVKGIGDDAAILRIPAGHEVLVTTDFSLEGVHFRKGWHSAEVVGHRCLTRGLSDIAAMGGKPIAAFLSLALPRELPQSWANGFLKGLLRLAKQFDVTLAGGDTAESPKGVLADIVVVGSAPKGKAIRRSGARPGDGIYVTGGLGGSAEALNLLFAGHKLQPRNFPQHFHPMPRIVVGEFLRKRKIASAMIDISDGLSTDLRHICEESGIGAEIEANRIPLARIGKPARPVGVKFALHGGDDYELLFTASSKKAVPTHIAGVPVACIGAITKQKKMILLSGGRRFELKAQGWEHFR